MPRARCSLGTSLWLKCCSVVFTCVYRVYLCIVSWIVENTLSRIHHNTCIIILVLCSLVYTVFTGIHIVLLVGRVLYQSTCVTECSSRHQGESEEVRTKYCYL